MKTLISTFTGLTIVIILGAVILGSLFWSRLPDMLSTNLSQKLTVAVSINNIRAGWDEIDINQIQVDNIPQSVLTHAFTCQQIAIKTPYTNYLNHDIVIDEVDLTSVYLGLEFDSASGTNGNWTKIMSNLQDPQAHHHKKKREYAPPTEPADRSLLIRKLVLTDIDTDVVYLKDGSKVHKLRHIPRMELTNISSQGGVPLDQLMNSILGNMLKEVFVKQNLNNMLQELLKQKNPVQEYLSPFKNLFNAIPPAETQEKPS